MPFHTREACFTLESLEGQGAGKSLEFPARGFGREAGQLAKGSTRQAARYG